MWARQQQVTPDDVAWFVKFHSKRHRAELASTLNNYLHGYNHHIPQRALGHVSPIDALNSWRTKKPELFVKRVYEQAELDTYIDLSCRNSSSKWGELV
jgi:hypothetical protein